MENTKVYVEYHLGHRYYDETDEMRCQMGFLNSGVGHEVFSFEETEHVYHCYDCRFCFNMGVVAPCFDCNSRNETGRSYFQERNFTL